MASDGCGIMARFLETGRALLCAVSGVNVVAVSREANERKAHPRREADGQKICLIRARP